MTRCIFLMRHAAHDHGLLTTEGREGACAVASRFAEWLDGRAIDVVVESTVGAEVEATVAVLVAEANKELERLGDTGSRLMAARDHCEGPALDDELRACRIGLGAYRPDRRPFLGMRKWLEEVSINHEAKAPLLVGNDPLIGWLAGELADEPIPVRRGELIFLRQKWRFGPIWWRRRWHLGWSISPVDDVSSITTKIESKMSTAKTLGAVITALIVFLVTDALLSTPDVYEWLAFVAFGTSSAGYFGALFLYDSLLMPNGFWGSRFPANAATGDDDSPLRPEPGTSEYRSKRLGARGMLAAAYDRVVRGRTGVERPPSPTDRVLQQAMVAIWNSMFRPATFFVGIGLVSLAIGAAHPAKDRTGWYPNGITIAAVTAAWVVALACWISSSRSRLGVSD